MTDSKTDSMAIYKNNFLQAVFDGEYEGDKPLPDVMNLLEKDVAGNTALHYCADKNYFWSMAKILNCAHPAVGLLIMAKNRGNHTALDFLLKNQSLTPEDIGAILKKMKSRSLPTAFAEMLESSLKLMQFPPYEFNHNLTSTVEQLYKKVTEENLMVSGQNYAPIYGCQKYSPPVSTIKYEEYIQTLRKQISSKK